MNLMNSRSVHVTLGVACLYLAGCGAHAHVEMAAASAIDSLCDQTQTALDEYQRESESADNQRERAVAQAFVERTRRDNEDAEKMNAHVDAFTGAMDRIRADRNVTWQRYRGAEDNVRSLREVSAGLRRLAVDSLSLEDDVKRYLGDLITQRTRAAAAPATAASPPTAAAAP